MAWDVVISGGGFGGLYAARQLERTMPRHSTRITLVNDVNFLLYTPFLPEAAAGHARAAPRRHAAARRARSETRLILGAVIGRDAARRTVTVRDQEGDEHELRYDRLLVAHGSVSRVLPVPGLAEHAVGFKSLADAIWLRNHVIQSLELADASEDPALREELSPSSSWAAAMPGWRRSPSSRTSPPTRSSFYPRASLHGMRWVLVEAADRVLPEIDLELADYALAQLRGRGIDIRLGTTSRRSTADVGPPLHRRDDPDPHRGLDGGRHAPSRAPAASACRSTSAAGSGSTTSSACEGEQDVWAIGDAAAVPDPARPGRPCPPTSQHAIRQGTTAGRNIAASLGRRHRAALHLQDPRASS